MYACALLQLDGNGAVVPFACMCMRMLLGQCPILLSGAVMQLLGCKQERVFRFPGTICACTTTPVPTTQPVENTLWFIFVIQGDAGARTCDTEPKTRTPGTADTKIQSCGIADRVHVAAANTATTPPFRAMTRISSALWSSMVPDVRACMTLTALRKANISALPILCIA